MRVKTDVHIAHLFMEHLSNVGKREVVRFKFGKMLLKQIKNDFTEEAAVVSLVVGI
jgi:hypothetical protein